MTVEEYEKHSLSDRYKTPSFNDFEELERKYWKNITFVAPLYGADLKGSITDPTCKEWNIERLGSILDWVEKDLMTFKRIATAHNYADPMTKVLSKELHYRHNNYILGKIQPRYCQKC